MTRTPGVHWSEGMFLRPHHMQVAERHQTEMLARELSLVSPFFWGLIRFELAADQLENFTFEARALDLKLKDGTLVSIPAGARLAPRPFKAELDQSGGRLPVYVGVPIYRDGAPNVLAPGERPTGIDRRFLVDGGTFADENTGDNPQPVDVRRLNARILYGTESRDGYETVQVAALEYSGQNRNVPVLSADFIPPVVEIGAWPSLMTLCQSVSNRLEAKYRLLLSEAAEQKLSPSSWEPVTKLQTLAQFVFLFQQLTRLPRLHPFTVYMEFCRLAGLLSVFSEGKVPVRVPLYDHDRLGVCFFEMGHLFDGLLERIAASRYLRLDFSVREDLLVADLSPEWTANDAELYIAVDSELEEREVRNRIDVMKVGSVRDIPLLKQRRLFGLDLSMLKRAPSGLPAKDDTHYLGIEKAGPYWQGVVRDHVLAISGGLDPKLSFSLYVVTKTGT